MNLCLGTVQFGMDYGVQGGTKPTRDAVFDTLDYAMEHGISVFDTASMYGDAENILGAYVERGKSGEIAVVSKLNPTAFDHQAKSGWKTIAIENVRESLERLHIPKLSAYLFHHATYLHEKDAVEALYAAVSEGLAGKIGVSIYTPAEAMKALTYDEIRVIQIPYNLFDRRLDQCHFFDSARERGVEIYARSSLLQGLLMMEPDRLPRHMRFAETYLRKFRVICEEYGVEPLRAAVCYVGNHPGIDYVVFGVDNIRQLSEYLSIQADPLPTGMMQSLKAAFENVEERLVNPTMWEK